MAKCGVYQILNKLNNKCYVGSSIDIRRRWRHHRKMLAGNKHHSIHLQRAWNKYGKANFVFCILEPVRDQNDLVSREQYWMDTLDSFRNGYNRTPRAFSTLGYKYSEKGRANVSRAVRQSNIEGRNKNIKLVPAQVTEIKKRLAAGHVVAAIAKDFNVSGAAISGIRRQLYWIDIPGPTLTPEQKRAISLYNTRLGVGKLTPEKVQAIRERLARGESRKELAAEYRVSRPTISYIGLGTIWKDVPGPRMPSMDTRYKLAAPDVREIRRRLATGESRKSIAKDYPVRPSTIGKIQRRESWKHIM